MGHLLSDLITAGENLALDSKPLPLLLAKFKCQVGFLTNKCMAGV